MRMCVTRAHSPACGLRNTASGNISSVLVYILNANTAGVGNKTKQKINYFKAITHAVNLQKIFAR